MTMCWPIQQNLPIKNTLNKGHLSNEATVCSPNHRAVYKSTSELGTPLYTQGSQEGPSGVVSTIKRFHCTSCQAGVVPLGGCCMSDHTQNPHTDRSKVTQHPQMGVEPHHRERERAQSSLQSERHFQ